MKTEMKNSIFYEIQFLKENLNLLKHSQNKAKKDFEEIHNILDKTHNTQLLAQKTLELSIISSHICYVEDKMDYFNQKLEALKSEIYN